MLIHLKKDATPADVEEVIRRLGSQGKPKDEVRVMHGDSYVLGVLHDASKINDDLLKEMGCVENVVRISHKWKVLSREIHPETSVVEIPKYGSRFGQGLTLVLGPCAVESYEQLLETAKIARDAGAHALRGGAFKPRTSPQDFQGLEERGLEYLAKVRDAVGLPIVTEIMEIGHIDLFRQYDVDIYQVGARNCQNFNLLKALAKQVNRPIIFKRGNGVTLDEFLNAANYIYSGSNGGTGNHNLVLCERGDKTFEREHRNVLNINNINYLAQHTHLPVIADPSHAGGKQRYVAGLARAAIAAGAHGLLVEIHYDPEHARCDGAHSLNREQTMQFVKEMKAVYAAVNE